MPPLHLVRATPRRLSPNLLPLLNLREEDARMRGLPLWAARVPRCARVVRAHRGGPRRQLVLLPAHLVEDGGRGS